MECPSNELQDLDSWTDRLNHQLNQRRYPFSGIFDLTERCNLQCVHCYINQPASDMQARHNELSTAEVIKILDTIAEEGCLFLVLTGGEVFIRPDFPEIYKHVLRVGILPTIFTNGTMITEELADMLAQYQPQAVDISLYGATRETYESVTRQVGSYDRCMQTIKMLHDRGVKVTLKAILLSLNQHELADMRAIAENMGLGFRYDGTIWPRLDGNINPFNYRLSTEEMFQIDCNDVARMEEWQNRSLEFEGLVIRNEYVFTCGAAVRSFHIDSQGNLCACTMLRTPSYNLKQIPFKIAWQKLGELRQLKRCTSTACQSCLVGSLCSQCPGWSAIVHGDLETPVDSVCKAGQIRYNYIQNK